MSLARVDQRALVDLGRALKEARYTFVTASPETHRRVEARARSRAHGHATSIRDVFGFSRPFAPDVLPNRMLELARAAGVVAEDGPLLCSRVRFSTLHDELFVHSAYPTTAADAVFFGPDTYRFCDLVAREMARRPAERIVDVGCGSGAGGLIAAKHAARARRVVLADINQAALAFAQVNAALAEIEVATVASDVLCGIAEPVDLVVANPPYMVDPARRTYRDGGGAHGEALAVRIVREALAKLEPGGRLVLYTGSAIVDGVDTFLSAARRVCDAAGAVWSYAELDPDVFGEEIETNDAYAEVERIAAVSLVATRERR